jgi:hypothetical protein
MDAPAFSMIQVIEHIEKPKPHFGFSSPQWPWNAIFGQLSRDSVWAKISSASAQPHPLQPEKAVCHQMVTLMAYGIHLANPLRFYNDQCISH